MGERQVSYINVTFSVRDGASPALQAKIDSLDPHRLATKLTPPLLEHWRDHLSRLPHNQQGYPSTGFWEDAARRVIGVANDAVVLLSCDKLGLRQRYHGGPIQAVHRKYLTIPIAPESYGTTVADWGDTLTLVMLADGRLFLCLWMGEEQTAQARRAKLGASVRPTFRAGEVIARRAERFSERAASAKKPDFILFRGSGSSATSMSRLSKQVKLKWLFRLIDRTKPQGTSDVVPDSLFELAQSLVADIAGGKN